jgi:membrane AbrB-like protein
MLLTLAAGGVFGIIFLLLKVPNGLRIGALSGSALLGIFFQVAWMPSITTFIVQVIAGALIGCTIDKKGLKRLPRILKPTAIVMSTFLVLTFGLGAMIHALSPLDWVTSLLSVVPGGVTDIPIIAADMGADTVKVAVIQLARFFLGNGFFPPMIVFFDSFMESRKRKAGIGCTVQKGRDGDVSAVNLTLQSASGETRSKKTTDRMPRSPTLAAVFTLAVAALGGLVGFLTGIPAGTLLFSVIAVAVLKLTFNYAIILPWVRKTTMLISGCYIGSLMTMENVYNFRLLAIPLVITLGGYIVNCFITGKILTVTCGFSRKEAMLATTPAGATDIALSSADMGVKNADVTLIHVFRAIITLTIFPQIINALLFLLQ